MTKLHVYYSIVTYTQNKIHEKWSIAYLNSGYIDHTDSLRIVSDANPPTVDLESTDHLLTIGRSSVDGRLTLRQLLFLKWVIQTWLTVSRLSGDSWPGAGIYSLLSTWKNNTISF